MEEIIFSGEDLRNSTIIDLDSWIRRYLIDEISGNVDSDHASSYFYYTDGLFYAGPVWDYDLAFGNSDQVPDPVSFYTTIPQKPTSRRCITAHCTKMNLSIRKWWRFIVQTSCPCCSN